MTRCIQDLKLAFITLNRNPIMVFADEINSQDLANLQEKRPKAYDAIRDKNHRIALTLTGLFKKSTRKGDPNNVELEYSDLATSWKEGDFYRFRQIFIGTTTYVEPLPRNWKFDANFILEKADDLTYIRRFDNLNYAQEFVESLFCLIRSCEDGTPAWRYTITDNWENDIMKWSTNLRNGFIHICGEILEKEMRNNENRIKGLLY